MSRSTRHGRQGGFSVRLDWGLTGGAAIAEGATLAVVVDVLSFTTTLTVALDGGATVWPCAFGSALSVDLAAANDAVLAVARSAATAGQISLSAASVRTATRLERLVLPSPNGSAIAQALSANTRVIGASLRNAAAVAEWIAAGHGPHGTVIAVVAAGERWPDGSLRPSVEDLWGAGAVINALRGRGWTALSPEAAAAAAAFAAVRGDLREQLLATVSGQELVGTGFAEDIEIAAELGMSGVVPLLDDGRFRDAADDSVALR